VMAQALAPAPAITQAWRVHRFLAGVG
jgi:hypothetical protein